MYFFRCQCAQYPHQELANYVTVAHFVLSISVVVVVFVGVVVSYLTSNDFRAKRQQAASKWEEQQRKKREEKEKKILEIQRAASVKRIKEAERLRRKLAQIENLELKISSPLGTDQIVPYVDDIEVAID